jgi:dimethylhistidine N-methyltransferase
MNTVRLLDLAPEIADFKQDIIAGLQQTPKRIAPKWFYDEEGSMIFERITKLKAYYPTRTEISILTNIAADWPETIGTIIEYGSGNSEKVRLLLPKTKAYVAIDISKEHMYQSCCQMASDFPTLTITALCADYTKPLPLREVLAHCPKPWMIFYPGSSIGNCSPDEAIALLRHSRQCLHQGDGLLIGVDLVKEKAVLENAYNDHEGVTAQFNRHLLKRISQTFGFPILHDDFRHIAFYNDAEQRIEMHLECLKAQIWHLDGIEIAFDQGEWLHTENSYKYHPEQFFVMLKEALWQPRRVWYDQNQYFGVFYAIA